MKNYFFLLLALGAGLRAQAQHLRAQQVPAAPLAAFQRTFPAASKAAWQRTSTTYEVSFVQPEAPGAAVFSPAGDLLETQTVIADHRLPPLARTALSQRFPHRQVDKIYRVVKPSGTVTYAALVCRGKDKDCQLTRFDLDGRPLPN